MKTENTFTPGQTVYLRGGNECVLVAKTDAGFVVHPVLEDSETGERYNGTPFITQHILPGEPKEVLGPEVTKYQQELSALRTQIQEGREALKKFNAENSDRLIRMKQHKALQRVDDFIAGKITHYVIDDYSGPKILALADSVSNSETWERVKPLRLLSLFGNSKGDLEWRLSNYSDGSGCSYECFPFCSYEDAQVKVKELLDAKADVYRDDPSKRSHSLETIVKCSMAAGLTPPSDITEALKALAIKSAETKANETAKAAREAEEKLAALRTDQP